LLQPLHGSWYARVHPLAQLCSNRNELGGHAFADRFPVDCEFARLMVGPTVNAG
jgi:hypothetical protein